MKNDNDLILARLKGAPMQQSIWPDARNPNLITNDNSPPVDSASHNSGEGDPSVMPDCAGGETVNADNSK